MKNRVFASLMIGFCLCGFWTTSFADLGLAAIAKGENGYAKAGQTVLTAVEAIYADPNNKPADIQEKLIAIINEAAASGDEKLVQYTLVAVLAGGGKDNLATGRKAINNSQAFVAYKTLTAQTVSAVALLSGGAGGNAGGNAGGGTQGGGTEGGGKKPYFGVELDNPFTWYNLFGSGDDDTKATPI